MNELASRLRALETRVSNLIRFGTVKTLNTETARVTVQIGNIITAPIPWLCERAGADKSWWSPEVGEQVVVLAMAGDLRTAIALPAIYQTTNAAPANLATVHRTVYADGTVVEYDRAAHKLKASVQGTAEITTTGELKLKGSTIVLDGPVSATEKITAPDANIAGIDFTLHKHTIPFVGITGYPHA